MARSVPNLYPVLAGEGGGETAAGETSMADSVDPLGASRRGAEPSLFASRPAAGAHEVIVSAPEHATTLAALPDERLDDRGRRLARADAGPPRRLLPAT